MPTESISIAVKTSSLSGEANAVPKKVSFSSLMLSQLPSQSTAIPSVTSHDTNEKVACGISNDDSIPQQKMITVAESDDAGAFIFSTG